jgi:hypothetical protein
VERILSKSLHTFLSNSFAVPVCVTFEAFTAYVRKFATSRTVRGDTTGSKSSMCVCACVRARPYVVCIHTHTRTNAGPHHIDPDDGDTGAPTICTSTQLQETFSDQLNFTSTNFRGDRAVFGRSASRTTA